jgi:AraC-like DNA-binding protein
VKWLDQILFKPRLVFIFLLLLSLPTKAIANNSVYVDKQKETASALVLDSIQETIASTQNFENQLTVDSILYYRNLAITYANKQDANNAVINIKKYLEATGEVSFINDHVFYNIKDTPEYLTLKQKYSPKFNLMSLLYIYAGLLGLFIFVILNVKRNKDRISTFLISLFVLFHSLFILHLSLYVNNMQYSVPQALFVSTGFSFLYGPLLYFYFKRSICNYKFKLIDALHLLPTFVLFLYISPFFTLSSLEKFNVLFNESSDLLPGGQVIILVKIISLSVYAFLILKIYKTHKLSEAKSKSYKNLWQRNIIALHIIYTFAYTIYSGNIAGIIDIPILFHIQIMVLVGVVFYVSYIAYIRPEVFKGKINLVDPINLFKYKKSGLTTAYSNELKENLLRLLVEDKIYKTNDINLETLSDMLGTTRHNTSQVINEHFGMNFFELINTYRINAAQEIFKSDTFNNLNIIEVAYEVGFNNKVTFNKSFKKHLSQTPSQFIRTLHA